MKAARKLNRKTFRGAGKSTKLFANFQFRSRKLSLADSSSSDDLDHDDLPSYARNPVSRTSGSELSLTAMSEEDESVASRKGLAFFGRPQKNRLDSNDFNSNSNSDPDSDSDSDGEFTAGANLLHGLGPLYAHDSDNSCDGSQDSDSDSTVGSAPVVTPSTHSLRGIKGLPKRRRSLYRRSSTTLPSGLKFEFDDSLAIVDDGPVELHLEIPEEEDIGEEVSGGELDFKSVPNMQTGLIVKSDLDPGAQDDEDYDYDDNDLLATLQAEKDIDEFLPEHQQKPRQDLVDSTGDVDEEEFLREEERYLVSEFETNGFDEVPVHLAYVSSDDELELDLDDVEFVSFPLPKAERPKTVKKKAPKLPRQEKPTKGPFDSEDEDDLYLWNYFFTMGPRSDSELTGSESELVFEEILNDHNEISAAANTTARDDSEFLKELSLEPHGMLDYDSGESTDIDESLPTLTNQMGSKSAKEVLSSRTADYRPPILGSWTAIETKPFGIIDGLLTRTLTQTKSQKHPRTWRTEYPEDLALELDEILNISELDNDDENDIRIWRDFNNNKKSVPLGAFRNKLHIQQAPEAIRGNVRLSRELNLPSKLRRRRKLIADAVQEGYRPTKLGLFSESVLADVEEVLGDDRDLMALIKGL